MNATQLNKISSFLTVRDVLAGVIAAGANPALPTKAQAYHDKLEEFLALGKQQAQPLRSAIADRDQTLQAAVHAALMVAGVVLSYADENKLGSLANRVRVRATDFRAVRTVQQVQLARQIYDAALPVCAELADHGVTKATLTDLKTKIEAADAMLSAPRRTTGEKKAATERLSAVIRQVDAILENQIDPLLVPLQDSNPELYARYKSARMIVNRPGSRNAGTAPELGLAPVTPVTPITPAAEEKLAA